MISFSLNPEADNRRKSAELEAAMADFLSRPGKGVEVLESYIEEPLPGRRDWVDPETVLKRKPRPLSLAERRRLRQMAGAI